MEQTGKLVLREVTQARQIKCCTFSHGLKDILARDFRVVYLAWISCGI